ncbi:response regulator [Neobacillus drentensis]|uniref:response regulator n=1 Tax=Neobacillus drentensis TaxID=220684 RepID=UPI002FFDD33E
MYSVLIVDDEPWIAYGIKRLIDWDSFGFTVIGEAHNGVAALEIILDKKPDIVLSDIRMPGLDGFELLDCINQNKLETKVILISGYSEFEYAQKAVRLGAVDYILKQIDKDTLISSLMRVKDLLQQKQQALKVLDTSLYDLFELFGTDTKIKICDFLTNKRMEFVDPYYRLITFMYQTITVSNPEEVITFNGIKCIRFRTGQNKISILINYDESKKPIDSLDFTSFELANAECIGISSLGESSTPISKLYQESDIAVLSSSFISGRKVIKYESAQITDSLTRVLLSIEVAIKEQKQDKINKGLEDLLDKCREHSLLIDQVTNIYNQLVSLIHKYYRNSNRVKGIEYLTYYQGARSFHSIEEIFDKIKMFFVEQPQEELLITNEMVKTIIDYINSHFTEEILLTTLAQKFNMSIGYLSVLIKKETGTTYTEYVTQKRLNMAKELLSDSKLSVYEIVRRVGYKDYFHFNKLFKKYFGLTPSKYRKI